MAEIYVTAGAWGAGKGAPLTKAEADGNIWSLSGRIAALEESPPEALSISNVTLVGTQLTFHRSDGAVYGPFTLPRAAPAAPVKEIAGATHTLALADSGHFIRCTNAAGCAISVPAHAAVPFAVREEIHVLAETDGPVTFDGDPGVSFVVMPGYELAIAQAGGVVTLKQLAAGLWHVFGLRLPSGGGSGSA